MLLGVDVSVEETYQRVRLWHGIGGEGDRVGGRTGHAGKVLRDFRNQDVLELDFDLVSCLAARRKLPRILHRGGRDSQ